MPPGLVTHDEPFEGFRVLDEVQSEEGLLLWQALRDVQLWARTPEEARPSLFHPGARARRMEQVAEAGSPLRTPLRHLARLLDPAEPVQPGELAEACQAVARWASDQAFPRTAMAFAETAAHAAPQSPGPAHSVGLLARKAADYRKAETWFRRTIALARRTVDWKYYGLGCVGLGNLYIQRGDYPTARTWLYKALRASRRHGLWSVKPMALHDLFCIAANGGQVNEAESFARACFRAYGRRHPRLPALVHDVALFWMLQGQFARALPLFRSILKHVKDRPHRLLALSSLARAAAGAGDRAEFASAWFETWKLVDGHDDMERVSESLINLAHGAANLGDAERAQIAASQALSVALRRGESEQRLAAETILDSVRNLRPIQLAPAPQSLDPEVSRAADALAGAFLEALNLGMVEV